MSRVAAGPRTFSSSTANNRLIRPAREYTGATRATYVPIAQR